MSEQGNVSAIQTNEQVLGQMLSLGAASEGIKAAYRRGDFKNYWTTTFTGKKVFPLRLNADDVEIEDIAHHLTLLNRWGGATKHPYSVAQHSYYVAQRLPKKLRKAGYLHDSSEYLLSDMIRPLKACGLFDIYYEIEDSVMQVIARKFDFAWPLDEMVVQADNDVLQAERLQLVKSHGHRTELDGKPFPINLKIEEWAASWWITKQFFLEALKEVL